MKLPKIELHLHLDCSISYNAVRQIDANISEKEYNENYVLPHKCNDLLEYIEIANKGLKLMQSIENIKIITRDVFLQLKNDNVIYVELRFAPLLHLEDGLTPKQVVMAVDEQVTASIKETGVKAGIILCTLRHFSEAQSMETAELVEAFSHSNVVGLDLAADEAGFPIEPHVKAFNYAHTQGILCTAHAGEAKGAESVWETLDRLKVSRIGHGVRSYSDIKLVSHLIENNIHLEVCPTSNVTTNTVASLNNHPINELYNKGVSLSINTDARSILDITLEKEYNNLNKLFNWNKNQFLKCNLEAIDHAFTTESIKSELRARIIEAYK